MRSMRSIVAFCLVLVLALSLAACDQAEKTVTLRGDMSADTGLPTVDTWVLTAKGDTVQTMKETLEIDLSDLDDTTKEYIQSTFNSLIAEPAQGIEGVDCNVRVEEDTYIIELTINCTGKTVKEAVEAGVLAVDGAAERISLKKTQSSLEGQGYKVVE